MLDAPEPAYRADRMRFSVTGPNITNNSNDNDAADGNNNEDGDDNDDEDDEDEQATPEVRFIFPADAAAGELEAAYAAFTEAASANPDAEAMDDDEGGYEGGDGDGFLGEGAYYGESDGENGDGDGRKVRRVAGDNNDEDEDGAVEEQEASLT